MSDQISRADVFKIIDKAFSQPMRDGVTLYADICLMLNALPTHANSRSTHGRDLISRADAIEAVHKYFVEALDNEPHETDEDGYDVFTDMKSVNALLHHNKYVSKALKALPSADAVHGEWNTGKPTKSGKYIVTLIGIGDYRFVDIMHYDKPCMPNIEVSGACWYLDDDEWGDVVYDDTDILAWMPLPKPYKGGNA